MLLEKHVLLRNDMYIHIVSTYAYACVDVRVCTYMRACDVLCVFMYLYVYMHNKFSFLYVPIHLDVSAEYCPPFTLSALYEMYQYKS